MTAVAPRRRTRTDAALDTLRRDVIAGREGGADMLPGERDLALHLGVSRTTVRRLLAELVEEGLLRHRQGVGTFILRPEDGAGPGTAGGADGIAAGPASPARLPGFVEEMRARGLTVATRDLGAGITRPTPEEAMMLGCSPDAAVLRLLRLRLVGGQALAVEQTAVPCRYLGSPDEVGASLYASLAQRGFAPVRALQRLQAIAIGETEAAQLGVAAGSAGVLVRRAAYLGGGAACEFTRSTFPGALYDAVTETVAGVV